MASTKVQKTTATVENDDSDDYEITQFRTTIPKNLAEALDLDQGTEVEWSIESGKKLSIERKDD